VLAITRDNGIGIAPEYQQRIFTPLKRLHGREIPGFGIGLATCRKMIEHHGGRIWVKSQAGVGSTFCFSLRKSQAAKPGSQVRWVHAAPQLGGLLAQLVFGADRPPYTAALAGVPERAISRLRPLRVAESRLRAFVTTTSYGYELLDCLLCQW